MQVSHEEIQSAVKSVIDEQKEKLVAERYQICMWNSLNLLRKCIYLLNEGEVRFFESHTLPCTHMSVLQCSDSAMIIMYVTVYTYILVIVLSKFSVFCVLRSGYLNL